MSETTLHSAVRNEKISSKQGFLQKLFAVWFDAFVYNQIWEDPHVDLQALELDSNSRVLTISSGGCNALNYLLQSPASVTASRPQPTSYLSAEPKARRVEISSVLRRLLRFLR